MSSSQWHRFYGSTVQASPAALFKLISDLPGYRQWLPASQAYGETTQVEPYPVQLGSRYHDGKPSGPGNSWWGSVIGFQPPGSIDFQHTIHVSQLRATVDVHIHYSLEPEDERSTKVGRWLVLDCVIPIVFRPLRRLVTSSFDRENVRTLAALKRYAEAHPELSAD